MRLGGIWFDILKVAALTVALSFFRKPWEQIGDDLPDGDCFPYPLSGAWGLPLPRADAGRGVRNYVPALSVTPFHSSEIRRD